MFVGWFWNIATVSLDGGPLSRVIHGVPPGGSCTKYRGFIGPPLFFPAFDAFILNEESLHCKILYEMNSVCTTASFVNLSRYWNIIFFALMTNRFKERTVNPLPPGKSDRMDMGNKSVRGL